MLYEGRDECNVIRRQLQRQGADTGDEKFNWRFVIPTRRDGKPFDENIKGLSHFWDKTYVNEPKVQTDDFKDSSFGGVISRKPFRT